MQQTSEHHKYALHTLALEQLLLDLKAKHICFQIHSYISPRICPAAALNIGKKKKLDSRILLAATCRFELTHNERSAQKIRGDGEGRGILMTV